MHLTLNLEMFVLLVFVTDNFVCRCLEEMQENSQDTAGKFHLFERSPRPSPINLIRRSMITVQTWNPLRFSPEHSSKEKIKHKVNEKGLEVTFDFDVKTPQISGGALKSVYEFDKLLLHWDNDQKREHGSYHAVEREYFAVEMQAYYKIVPGAPYWYGLPSIFLGKIATTVVVSQFFKLDDQNDPAIEQVLNDSASLSLDQLIPPLQEYVSYKGSLVVAPYTEDVKWIISLKPKKITKTQINKFREIATSGINEARSLKPLYGRRVFYRVPWNE